MTGIEVQPNPAPEGGTVTITFPGNGPWFVHVDGGHGWTQVTNVDPMTRKATIDVPGVGGGSFTISDLGSPPTEAVVPVEGNRRG